MRLHSGEKEAKKKEKHTSGVVHDVDFNCVN